MNYIKLKEERKEGRKGKKERKKERKRKKERERKEGRKKERKKERKKQGVDNQGPQKKSTYHIIMGPNLMFFLHRGAPQTLTQKLFLF